MRAALLVFRLMGYANSWKQSESADSGSPGQRRLLTVESHTSFTLLTRSKNSREHAVELFNRKVLADVSVRARVESGVHLLFVVPDAGENNDRKRWIRLSHKGDERNSVHFRHLKIDNGYFAVVLREPGSGLEAIGQSDARMATLTQIRDQELSDARVIIDDEELGVFAFGRLHLIISITTKALSLPILTPLGQLPLLARDLLRDRAFSRSLLLDQRVCPADGSRQFAASPPVTAQLASQTTRHQEGPSRCRFAPR